jgi:hypothetical protein
VISEDRTGDAEIRTLLKRLARPHPSGGDVIERAALLASGSDFPTVMKWIADHSGVAETVACEAPRRGLHGQRQGLSDATKPQTPSRFVLPAEALA